jgi:hypothetical protein
MGEIGPDAQWVGVSGNSTCGWQVLKFSIAIVLKFTELSTVSNRTSTCVCLLQWFCFHPG